MIQPVDKYIMLLVTVFKYKEKKQNKTFRVCVPAPTVFRKNMHSTEQRPLDHFHWHSLHKPDKKHGKLNTLHKPHKYYDS